MGYYLVPDSKDGGEDDASDDHAIDDIVDGASGDCHNDNETQRRRRRWEHADAFI